MHAIAKQISKFEWSKVCPRDFVQNSPKHEDIIKFLTQDIFQAEDLFNFCKSLIQPLSDYVW